MFLFLVHSIFDGHIWETLAFGWRYGIASDARSIGIHPKYSGGWDGQFYYAMSNDPFALKTETVALFHGQRQSAFLPRIFIPFLSHFVSRLLGFTITPPLFFHLIQHAITMAGFFILATYLSRKGFSPCYALGWLLGGNALRVLLFGLNDPVADSLLIFSLYFIDLRKWTFASLAILCLVLTRESYALFGSSFFMYLTYLLSKNKIVPLTWVIGALPILIPGIVWLYFAIRFGPSVYSGTELLVSSHLVQMGKLLQAIGDKDWLTLFAFLFVAMILGGVIWGARRRYLGMIFFLPCAFLLTLVDYPNNLCGAYLKYLGGALIVLLWYRLETWPRFIGFLLIANVVLGLAGEYNYPFPPDMRFEIATPEVKNYGNWPERQEPNCQIALPSQIDVTLIPDDERRGTLRGLTQSYETFHLDLRNNTHAPLLRTHPWRPGGIYLTYRWLNSAGQILIQGSRIALPHRIAPMQTVRGMVSLRSPSFEGSYDLLFSIHQEGCEKQAALKTTRFNLG